MTFQTEILADVARRQRAIDASPARLERRRAARLLEAVARCCRPTLAARLRAAAARLAA
jgi:F0F1-type ATP synthase epsilon subunit